jgi:hypothetical protein
MTAIVLIKDAPGVATGEWKSGSDTSETGGIRSVQVGILGSGVIGATVVIEGCNDGRFPQLIATFTLAGTGVVSDAIEISFPWEQYRARVSAVNGTGTIVSATMKV